MSVGDVLLDIDLANFVLGKHQLEASGGADVTVDTQEHPRAVAGGAVADRWPGPRLGGSCRSACRCSEGPTGGGAMPGTCLGHSSENLEGRRGG